MRATSIAVYSLRGTGTVARASVQLGRGVYGAAAYQSFIVGAAPLPEAKTLLLLRRVDVAGYPLVALRAIRAQVKPRRAAVRWPDVA